jgi:hypothetical protein
VPIFDISCFYTLNGQPFRNAAGQVVTFTATEIGLGQSNLTTTSNTVTFGRLSNIESSTVMKPRDIQL